MNNYNLYTNFQPLLKNAIKKFLSTNDNFDSDKTITTSLRLSSDLKQFYENLAEAESTSLNTAIINTLSKVKECTISHYKYTYDSVEDLHLTQVNSLINIIETSNVDLNDLDNLFEWLNGRKPEREELIDKRAISKLFNKDAQKNLCTTFGYNYSWLSNNQHRINEINTDFRWYKNVRGCISKIIFNYYLNSPVSSLNLGFIVSDMHSIKNIYVNKFSETPNYVTPFLMVNRNINGIHVRTYHSFESNDINYERCRNYFIMLVKMSLVLQNAKVLNDVFGYLIPHETHDKIKTGHIHLSEVCVNKENILHEFYFDDFEEMTPISFPNDNENKTTVPNIFNMLDIGIIDTLAHHAKNEKGPDDTYLKITDTRIFLNRIKIEQISKYLNLYGKALNIYMDITEPTRTDPALYINKLDILKIHEEIKGTKSLVTSF